MRWRKPFLELTIITALASFSLAACGERITEAQPSVQESEIEEGIGNNESEDDIIKQTTDSLKPYLEYIGTDTSSGDVEVSQEFLDNLDNVFVMGYTGTVNHALTEGAGDTITSMDWTSNEAMDHSAYNDFLGSLDSYFGNRGTVHEYDNISQGDVWIWTETENGLWPVCFNDNGKAVVRWYANSAVNIPTESIGDPIDNIIDNESALEIPDGKWLVGKMTGSSSLRSSKEYGDNEIEDYPEGTIVQIIRETDGWYFVKVDGNYGYLGSRYVDIQEGQYVDSDGKDHSPTMPKRSNHTCIECGKPATHSMTGVASGEIEWYCDDHWNEMSNLLNEMQKELDEVEELTSYDAYLNYGSGSIPFWFSEDALERYISASVKDDQGTIDEMTANGEIGFASKGTKCNIVKSGYTKYQVKLLDGAYSGSTVWVLAEAVQKTK